MPMNNVVMYMMPPPAYDEGRHGGTRPPRETPLAPFEPSPVIHFTVLGHAPSTNQAYRIVRFGGANGRAGMAISREGKDWKRLVTSSAATVRRLLNAPAPVWSKPTKVRVALAWRFARANQDADGPVKLVLDALQGELYENDSQIYDYRVTKSVDPEQGVEITVEAMP